MIILIHNDSINTIMHMLLILSLHVYVISINIIVMYMLLILSLHMYVINANLVVLNSIIKILY